MIEKIFDLSFKDFGSDRFYEVVPPILSLFLYSLNILAYDPLSPNSADAQKLLTLIHSYSPVMFKYEAEWAFWSGLVFSIIFFAGVIKRTIFSNAVEGIMNFAGLVFLAIGGLCTPFLVFASASPLGITSLSDLLLKVAGFFYCLYLCCLIYEEFSKHTQSTLPGSTKKLESK